MIRINKILVPTDFSDCSKKALRYAVELAEAHGAEVLILHSIQPTAYPAHNVIRSSGFPDLQQQIEKSCREHMAALRAEIGDRVPSSEMLIEGIPHSEIVRAADAEGIDLIVIATHGYGGIKHALLGSTTEKVVRRAPCPVLTVRESEREFVAD